MTKRLKKNVSFVSRFKFALSGIAQEWARGFSFRVQTLCALALFGFCIVYRPPAIWCAVFVTLVSLVLGLELVNSALEALIDRLHPETHPEIKFVKDCLAGAVLVASIGSVLVFAVFLYAII